MEYFETILSDTIVNERENVARLKEQIRKSPKGSLIGRKRARGYCYYIFEKGKYINITNDHELISKLIDKKVAEKQLPLIEENIELMEDLLKEYNEGNMKNILEKLPSWYRDVLGIEKIEGPSVKQNQEIYSPKTHVHETQAGIFVRSKSEVIIANTLFHHGIPFEYEKQLIIKDSARVDIYSIYPDFTIYLPDEKKILWEHLGLLANEDYRIKVTKKLGDYQRLGYQIGDNLILTMDNNKGSCNSIVIDEIVRELILPFMK